jgi:transmembrane sensor
MQQNKFPNAEILFRFLKDELSEEESKLLNEWANQSQENRTLLDEVQDRGILLSDFRVFAEDNWETAFERLSEKGVVFNQVVPIKQRSYRRYLVAAAVFLSVAVGVYIFVSDRKKLIIADKENTVVVTDVPPGQYKARLTLADGSTIVLDSAALGKLAQQGNVEIQNKDGKLVYVPSASNAAKGVGIAYNTLTTAKGETFGTQLSDGSKIWLNAGSSVRYPVAFTGDVRRVEITGEAYFEVAHSNKPFFVSVRGMEVQVLGTIFTINAYEDEEVIKTTLAEGKVKVKTNQAIMVLKPGQQAQATRAGLKLKENADVEQALAWKNGFFQFDNDNLKTVMRQLGRWYDVTVIYEGAVPDISFSGKLRMQSKLSEVLTLLEKWEVRFRAEGNRVIVLPESN